MLCKSTRLYRANGSHSHQRLSVVRPSAAGGRRGGRRRVDGRRGVGEALRPLDSARLTATVDGVPGPSTAFGRRRRLVRSGATSIHPDHMDRWTRPANKVVVPLSDPPLQSSTPRDLDGPPSCRRLYHFRFSKILSRNFLNFWHKILPMSFKFQLFLNIHDSSGFSHRL